VARAFGQTSTLPGYGHHSRWSHPRSGRRAGRTLMDFPVIALVCSLGGLDALSQVLRRLPVDLDAAVVVLQHVDPETRSGLAGILAKHCALPVAPAADGDALRPGHVLVAPSGSHTLITGDGRIALIASGARPPYRPSADLLLTSLALAVGPRAIAVVMTGYGNDGATGATAVNHLGGVVIATDKATSTEFAMPQATIDRKTVTDYVVGLNEVAALLLTLTRPRS
jgi:two-component system chemotaxis response regulator CheB